MEANNNQIFQCIPSPCMLLHTDAPFFTIKDANEPYLQVTGKLKEELLGVSIFEAFPDDPAQPKAVGNLRLLNSLQTALTSKKTDSMPAQRYDIQIPGTLEFAERYGQAKNIPVLNDTGIVVAILHVVEDLTESTLTKNNLNTLKYEIEKAKEILRQEETILKQGTWELDLKTNQWFWSAGYFNICGFEDNEFEVTLEKYLALVHPDDRVLAAKNIQDTIAFEKDFINHQKLITKTQQIIDVQIHGRNIKDETGIPIKLIGVIQDITEQTRNINELQSAKEVLRKMMDYSLEVICTIDEYGNFKKVGAASFEMWGYHPEEIVNKGFIDLVYPEDKEKSVEASIDIRSGLKLTNFQNRYIHKNGKVIPMIWSARWDEQERLIYCTAKDATEKLFQEKTLLDSEKKYKLLFESNPMPMLLWDFETLQIIDANKEASILYGYTKAEFLALTVKDIRPPEELQLMEEYIQLNDNYGPISHKIWKHQKKDGTLMMVDISGHLIDYNGRKCSLVNLNNVTEQLKAAALKEFEKRDKEALINNTNDLIWSVNRELKLIAANQSFVHYYENSFGITIKPGDPLIIKGDFSPDVINRWMDDFHKALAGESLKKDIYTQASPQRNTQEKWTEVSFVPIYNDQAIEGIVCFERDITDVKIAEKKIAESELRYRSIVESSMDGILLIGKDGKVFSANSAACSNFQMTEEELCQTGISGIIDQESPYLTKLIKERALTGKARGELIFIRKDGSKFPGEITSVIFSNKIQQEITSMVIRDITSSAKYINAIETQNKKLRDIAYVQSHIVRAPLARMMGLASLIKDLDTGTEEGNLLIKYFEQSSLELDQVIKDIVNQAGEHVES